MTPTGGPRLANVLGRATLVWEEGHADVAKLSANHFGPDPQALFGRWADFATWASGVGPVEPGLPNPAELGPPVPRPSQIFAIGLNYRDHSAEAGYDTTGLPQVFTKFPSCLAGPCTTVPVVSPRLDWEVELVVAIASTADAVSENQAWSYVAGLTVGQDLSARDVQLAGQAPQWSMGKSFPGFGPTGPQLVGIADLGNPEGLHDPDDLVIECELNGETVQKARTSELIWSVPELIARLSAVCTLLPGDLIFTGTPAGVGNRRTPPRYLQPGDRLVSRIGGIGELVTTFATAPCSTGGNL